MSDRFDPNTVVRPEIEAMEPYRPIVPFEVLSAQLGREPADIIKLDANENPYGPSPAVLRAIANNSFYHIYPDPEATALRVALAAYVGVPATTLLAGAGADELIDLVLRAVLAPGEAVIDCPPSFGMYPFSTAVNAGRTVNVPRRADFSLDLDQIETAVRAERAKVLFICSPNNPDGSVVDDESLRRLLALPLLVVLDEAYVDFAELAGHRHHLDWVVEHDNLVVLRTFSKLAGLAGLRIGYGAFPAWLMPHLFKIKQPYNVNVAANAAALAALTDRVWMLDKLHRIMSERQRLFSELQTLTFLEPWPGYANFVLCRVVGRDALYLKRTLEAEGILVRYFDKPGLDNCIRISVGRPDQSERLLATLRQLDKE